MYLYTCKANDLVIIHPLKNKNKRILSNSTGTIKTKQHDEISNSNTRMLVRTLILLHKERTWTGNFPLSRSFECNCNMTDCKQVNAPGYKYSISSRMAIDTVRSTKSFFIMISDRPRNRQDFIIPINRHLKLKLLF